MAALQAQNPSNIPAPGAGAALWVMLCGTFMVTLDFFIVMVALPSIQSELGASEAALQWVVGGYGVAMAAGLITGGRLGDRFGRRRIFLIGLVLFLLASAACGLAPSIGVLLAARVLQGLAGAVLQPQVLALLGATYKGAARARAFGAYAVSMGLAGVGGQLIGGLLVESNLWGSGWRACFLINLPLGLLALALRARLPSAPADASSGGFDLMGVALVTAALMLLAGPLVEGRQQGWPWWSLLGLGGALPLLALLALQQRALARRGGQPLLPPLLFAIPSYVSGLIATLMFFSGVGSFYFVLALHLQQALGWGALASGAMFSVLAGGFFFTSMQAQALARATRGRALVVGGVLLAVAHLLQAALVLQGWATAMLPVLLLQGAGLGMVMAPLASAALADVPALHAGVASGVLATMQQVGNSIGVALIGIVYFGSSARAELPRVEPAAFALCLACLAALALLVAAQVSRLQQRVRQDTT